MTRDLSPRLLVVDDEPGMLSLLQRFAENEGFEVISRPGGRDLINELPGLNPDAALLDRNMPEVGGLELLKVIRQTDPSCQVILMTAEATVESAIEAVKLGAVDYLSKPLDFDRLRDLLGGVHHGIARRQRLLAADTELAHRFEFCGMVGRSPVMQELFDLVRRLAPHARTALITGETGTGKELVARALHKMGPRKDRKLIAFNCSTLVETLAESELFGHVRGAFTGAVEAKPGLFEQSDGATLFLDEIGELPMAIQAKLLRIIEYGEVQRVGASESRKVDVRVITATNRRLPDEVAAGRFRQDLYYRLNVVEIPLAPLRERRDDIAYLTAAFVQEFAARFQKRVSGLSPGAERLLYNAPWTGNIRELRNVIERACMLSDGRVLSERELLTALGGARPAPATSPPNGSSPHDTEEMMPELDRTTIEQALQQVGGNRSAAARKLGISRRALYRRLDTFGLR